MISEEVNDWIDYGYNWLFIIDIKPHSLIRKDYWIEMELSLTGMRRLDA